LCSVVGVTVLAWLSRGLHLDGLADTFDGWASMRHGPAALEVMRDPRVGALGAAGMVLVLMLQVSALAVVISDTSPVAVVAVLTAAGLLSRGLLPWAARAGTPSAPSGLGQLVVGRTSTRQGAAVMVITAALAVGLLVWAGLPLISSALAVTASVLSVGAVRKSACRRFGAVTGDVLGAMVELAVTCALLVAALAA
jgi:adenosylcobinamide-GDP ribazoletransferase